MGVDCQGFLAAICPTLKKTYLQSNSSLFRFKCFNYDAIFQLFIVNYIYSGDLKKDNRNNCKYDYYKQNFFLLC